MLTVTFTNDGTGQHGLANYDVRVAVNGRELYRGKVERHLRSVGWECLVKLWANTLEMPIHIQREEED